MSGHRAIPSALASGVGRIASSRRTRVSQQSPRRTPIVKRATGPPWKLSYRDAQFRAAFLHPGADIVQTTSSRPRLAHDARRSHVHQWNASAGKAKVDQISETCKYETHSLPTLAGLTEVHDAPPFQLGRPCLVMWRGGLFYLILSGCTGFCFTG